MRFDVTEPSADLRTASARIAPADPLWTSDLERLRDDLRRAEARLQDKELLIREVDHRACNALHLAAALLTLQARRTPDPSAREALETAVGRLEHLAHAHAAAYLNDGRSLNVSSHLHEVCSALGEEKAGSSGAHLTIEGGDYMWPVEVVSTLGLFVNEAVTNAVKYAFPDGREGRIAVAVWVEGDTARVEVRDDGVGLPPDAAPGLGVKIMQALARRLDGDVRPEPGERGGATVRLSFPRPGGGVG